MSGEFDLGLTFQSTARPPLLVKSLYEEELVFVAGQYHQATTAKFARKSASLEELGELLREYGLVSFKSVFDLRNLNPLLFKEFDALEQINNIETLIWQVSTGHRFGLIPAQTLNIFEHSTGISQLFTRNVTMSSMHLMYKPTMHRSDEKKQLFSQLLHG